MKSDNIYSEQKFFQKAAPSFKMTHYGYNHFTTNQGTNKVSSSVNNNEMNAYKKCILISYKGSGIQ